jgi:hypothetical protein
LPKKRKNCPPWEFLAVAGKLPLGKNNNNFVAQNLGGLGLMDLLGLNVVW